MTSQDKTSNAENNAQNSLTAKVYRTSEYLDVWDAVLVKYCRMQRKSRIQSPLVPGGGDSHMKQTGMLVVSLRGVNFGFWSRLGCSGQSANILSRQGLV